MKSKIFGGVAATAALLLGASSANALTINLIDEGGVAGSQADMGFKIAAAYWESVISTNVSLNFGVSYAALPTGVIGSTGSAGMDYTLANFETGFNATKSNSTLDQTAVLPTLVNGAMKMITSGPQAGQLGDNTASNKRVYDTDTTGAKATNNKVLYLNTAVVKSIGGTAVYDELGNPDHLDGDITFSSDFGFDFDPTNGTSANTFDFIGTAIHEMGHALGFVSGVDSYDYFGRPNGPGKGQVAGFNMNTTSWFSSLDLFRYSNDPTNLVSGTGTVLDLSVGSPSYFSIDGGLSQLFGNSKFATGSYNGDGDQASHWKDNNGADGCSVQIGIMDPTECYAQADYVTAQDLAAFDVIGWNLTTDILQNPTYHKTTASIYADYQAAHPPAVPEPASWAMMLAGFGVIGGAMRRRSARISFAI